MHLGSCLFAVVATSSAVVAQLSSDGCANLESAFTGFGFATTHGAVNAALTNCGCAFAVNVGAGQTAAAACAKEADSGEWSVASLSISNPPTTRGSFPPVLISPQANAVGFNFLTSLSFTNNALTGNALMKAESLPTRTASLDISNNPSLNPLPGVVGGGGAPNYSFQNLTQNGNQNICCPTANHIAITCVPTASDCTTLEVDDTTPDVPNNGKAPAMSASVSSTVTTTSKLAAASSSNGGNNEPATAASSSARASASANSAQNSGVGGTNPTGNSGLSVGAIVSISLGCVLVAAALLVGAFGQISRMRQKPVVLQTDAQEAEWGLIGTGALPSRADGQFAIAKV